MKKYILQTIFTAALLIGYSESMFSQGHQVTDIDGNYYNIVTIGSQIWMLENLKVTKYNDGTPIQLVTDNTDWQNSTIPGYCWYNNDETTNKDIYGALYTLGENTYPDPNPYWSKNVCPVGWKVPAYFDFYTLYNLFGGPFDAGGKLKESGTAHWISPNTGATNESGFTALPGGHRGYDGAFSGIGDEGYWWSSTIETPSSPFDIYYLQNNNNEVFSRMSSTEGNSVRCIHAGGTLFTTPRLNTTTASSITPTTALSGGIVTDDGNSPVTARGVCWSTSYSPTILDNHTTNGTGTGSFTSSLTGLSPNTKYYIRAYATNSMGTAYGDSIKFTTYKSDAITDVEGNYYNIVTIGSQTWMAENLKSTQYTDGTPIPNITDPGAWDALISPGYCWYDNDEASNKNTYGALYNWYTVNMSNLCPTGWHIPTDPEWMVLMDFLGGTNVAGGKLKEAGYAHWNSPNIATNESGFTALPGGFRWDITYSGAFNHVGNFGKWWSATEYILDPNTAIAPTMTNSGGNVSWNNDNKELGLSVRCIKASSGMISVTNTADDGVGSFRYALNYTNSTVGIRDTITFNIPGPGPFTIEPLTLLPQITDPVIIDGFSQPGASAPNHILMIELSGTNLGPDDGIGLSIYADNCLIRGLVINRFRTGEIEISSGLSPFNPHLSRNNTISGNFIGTDVTGKNIFPSNMAGVGILLGGDNNKIGGKTFQERNVVCGNVHGIMIGGKGNSVLGNFIGTDISGKLPLMNYGTGVLINYGSDNTVGGTDPGERNVISGNNQSGITIQNNTSTGNRIVGNYIGVDVTGQLPLGNGDCGIRIQTEASDNVVGGSKPGEGNVISDNSNEGILVKFTSVDDPPKPTQRNIIQGNFIGTDANGTEPIGNGKNGIRLDEYAILNVIGGTERGAGNTIAFNGNSGILCGGINNPSSENTISANSIYSNSAIGIDLGSDGVTQNDVNDTDNGPNNLQNFPVLDSVKFDLGAKKVFVHGYLQSISNSVYTLEFFANKMGDNTGYGEGQTYLGSAQVTTAGNGKAVFGQTFAISSSWGDVINATATDSHGNTSEFSENVGGLQSQIIASDKWPFYYRTNVDGVLRITDGSDILAVDSSFVSWTKIPTANIDFRNGGPTTSKCASASDGINLITFTDDQFPFSPGVLAIAAKTLKIVPGTADAQIIDADIVINPVFSRSDVGVGYNNPNAGTYDIQSIVTHEIGHVLGLLHSGIYNSTMFYMLGQGTKLRSLEQDDKSWASYRYPKAGYTSTYGSISGNIIYGYDNQPVAGALVLAINISVKDSVHAYSDANGNYLVPGLRAGQYNIYIEPLDGSSKVYKLKPGNISSYMYCNTLYNDYPGEFYSDPESNVELTESPKSVGVTVGHETTGINLITNKDDTDPEILSVYPPKDTTNIDVTSDIIITFSEPVDKTTLTDETCYLESGGKAHGVNYTTIGNSSSIILVALDSALKYSTSYNIHVTSGVKDLRGNPLQSVYQSSFTTGSADLTPPEITGTYPVDKADTVFVTDRETVFFSEPMDKTSVENSFTLSWADGQPVVTKKVDGSFTWDKDNKSLTFTPLISLKEGTEYTITVSTEAMDLSGNHLAAINLFKFTTVPTAPPVIVYLGPVNNEVSVSVTSPVVVDFSEPIDPASVNTSTFSLSLNGALVAGEFELLNENSRVIFRSDANLEFGKTYLITLTTGIKDISNPSLNMTADKTGTFVTASQLTVPHISYLEPPAGIIGSDVVIAGTGFDPNPLNNTVKFNTTSAVVTSATLTSLTTKVPLGASSGPVTVAGRNAVQADNSMYFYVIPQSDNPCDVVVSNSSVGTKSTKDVAVDPNAAFAYVTNPLSDQVTVLDLVRSTVVKSISVGKTPMKIDINPSGSLAYVTNFNSNDVSVISLATNTVIRTIKVGIQPYGIAVTPNGKGVYVANYFSENVSLIDVDPYSGGFDHVVANVPTGTKTTNVAVTPDAGMVLVTGDCGLRIIDANPKDANYNCVVATASSGTKTKDVAVSPDAGLAIVSTEEGNLLVINLLPENGDYSDAVVANVPSGTNISNVKVSGDNMFVYVTATDKNELLVYKITQGATGATNGSSVSGITLVPHSTISVGDAPEGLVLDSKAENIFVIDGATGSRQVTTIRICCGPVDPAKAIGDLIMSVQNMINAGNISQANGKEIIDKLNLALSDLLKGKTKNAINDLNAFSNKVKAQINGHKISAAQGQPLINSVNIIITQLNGTKSALAEPYLGDTEQVVEDLIPISKLGLIYPNPFSQTITVNYEIAENKEALTKVQLMVYDVNGRLVSTLIDQMIQSGCYTASWNGYNDSGDAAPYGTYFVLFRAGTVKEVSKIMLIKPR